MTFRCDGAFDIECAKWTKFATAATFSKSFGAKQHHRRDNLVEYLLSVGGHWWAHGAGKYDFLLVLEYLRDNQIPCSVDMSGARVSRIVCGKLTMRDSYMLLPFKASVAFSIAGLTQQPLDLPCICDQSCGGYCSIRVNDRRPEVQERCMADAEYLYRALWALHDKASAMDMELRGTVGSTAWVNAKRLLDLPDSDLPPPVWRNIRGAYYGGRVGVFRPVVKEPIAHWDMSSAYPSALATTAIPIGQYRELGRRESIAALAQQKPGVYQCTMDVPEQYLPPLPHRHSERIRYPFGRITGTWCQLELETAIQHGAKVADVHTAIVWDSTSKLFGPLMRRWIAQRVEAGKKSGFGQFLRWVSNSLPGKLAESPDKRAVKMFPDASKIRVCHGLKPCSIRRCTGACRAWEQIDMDGAIWGIPYLRHARSGHIHWATYLVAATRTQWLDAAEKSGPDLVYGDTDSIWTTAEKPPGEIGNGLNQWERKGSASFFECIGPRAYRYRDERGESWVKTAGISISDEDWLNGGGGKMDIVPFLSAAATGGRMMRRERKRWSLNRVKASQGIFGDRILDPGSGRTYPIRHGNAQVRDTES